MAVGDLAALVGGDALEGRGIGGFVVLDRDRRRHPAHRMRPAAVAGVDQAQRISREKGAIHGHRRTVGDEPLRRPPEALDEAEDIVPAPAIEPDDMVLQREQHLVHLERRRQRLDQQRHANGSARQAQLGLGEGNHLAPPRRLAPALELGQIIIGPDPAAIAAAVFFHEIWPRPGSNRRLGIVKQIQAEIEQRPRQRRAVDRDMRLVEVEPARADDQHRAVFGRRGSSCRSPDRQTPASRASGR